MKIGIIDADLLAPRNHRFPNLACEKIAGYYKEKGYEVRLILDSTDILGDRFDEIFVSKVFTDTEIPEAVQTQLDALHIPLYKGGTGFFFDRAEPLSKEIEHHMPDYTLYDEWIQVQTDKAREAARLRGKDFNEVRFLQKFSSFRDYSIGFLTRGCFRRCEFCVNRNSSGAVKHSPLSEFYDPSRKKLCFLDDNFLACPDWKPMLEEVISKGIPFKFKQGLDERVLTEEKCSLLFGPATRYDGDITFAFDNDKDYELIHSKLKLIRRHTDSGNIKFYVLCGYESTDHKDIENIFHRIELLLHYRCLPYIMRYMDVERAPWKESPWRGMYVALARWCNQPNMVKKMTFREFCQANQDRFKSPGQNCATFQAMLNFEKKHPDIAARYFDIRYGEKNPRIAD